MRIEIRKSAIKDLQKINEPFKSKLHEKIISLKNFPDVSNIKKLTNFEPAYRMRVGDYRVLFDVVEDTIFIGRVLHRQESYE
ncbi:plasmid stabilization system [Sulfuricurvum kujiense DSM 16994]|jgi:mRNA interferase RelE/StbE|uniref:Plasmid stabilization system n=1 Tax=Sulfuricurvum kujiense (strain ATCC BAA-921 / DSM 16994 / JCM 11577 / YK-1) TaxID=709032 RepID=E4U1E9_SULKY|nr:MULTISPECIES: type II toxin-antitoxin system RelE/ParE family toxin [Sulfuricurvum]ADR34486.1 plasmid stabilization system [Sulfuricurvum kujiense DSM 16994]